MLKVSDTLFMVAGIDFMINLHSCITVYKKKKEGALEEAGEELMVNKQTRIKCNESAGLGPQ